MPNVDVLLGQYPEAFGELFDVEAITTGPGFLNAEMVSIIAPVLFLVYGIGRGARAMARCSSVLSRLVDVKMPSIAVATSPRRGRSSSVWNVWIFVFIAVTDSFAASKARRALATSERSPPGCAACST